MKSVVFAVSMACFSSLVMAEDFEIDVQSDSALEQGDTVLPVEEYNYDMELDIDHVISIEGNYDACGMVPVQMTYEDSQGKQHRVQYIVMGSGCSNG